jgi:hypothetical protein
MSLHSDVARLRRLRTELNRLSNEMGHPLAQAMFTGGHPESVGVTELRHAAISTYHSMAVLESITDGLIAALSNIEIRLHQLTTAGPAAGLQH